MNPLPQEWFDAISRNPSINVFVMLDTAMQHALGDSLVKEASGALSFFDAEPSEARKLGLWLLTADKAALLGVDGVARGVSWWATTMGMEQVYKHLHAWAIAPLPDGTRRGYLRIGDARVLQALRSVWSKRQHAAFFAPFTMFCHADRDGCPVFSLAQASYQSTVASMCVSTRLAKEQYQALLEASVPDQLLHELKGYVVPHVRYASHEARHAMAVAVIAEAKEIGYDAPYDWLSFIGWKLKYGQYEPAPLRELAAVRNGLHEDALWNTLVQEWEAME